jgi:hypothetical protein
VVRPTPLAFKPYSPGGLTGGLRSGLERNQKSNILTRGYNIIILKEFFPDSIYDLSFPGLGKSSSFQYISNPILSLVVKKINVVYEMILADGKAPRKTYMEVLYE